MYGQSYFGLWFVMGALIGSVMGTMFGLAVIGTIAGGGLGLLYAWIRSRDQV